MAVRCLAEMLITNGITNRLVRHSFTSAANDAAIHIVNREECWLPERIDRDPAILAHQDTLMSLGGSPI